MLFEKPTPLALVSDENRPVETEEERAKALEPKADVKARILAAGERVAHEHADILRELAR